MPRRPSAGRRAAWPRAHSPGSWLGGARAAGALGSGGWVRPACAPFCSAPGKACPGPRQPVGFAHCTTPGLMSWREARRCCPPRPQDCPAGRGGGRSRRLWGCPALVLRSHCAPCRRHRGKRLATCEGHFGGFLSVSATSKEHCPFWELVNLDLGEHEESARENDVSRNRRSKEEVTASGNKALSCSL